MIIGEFDFGVSLKWDAWNIQKDLGKTGLKWLLVILGMLLLVLFYPLLTLSHDSWVWGLSGVVSFFALLIFGLAGGFGLWSLNDGTLFRSRISYPLKRTRIPEPDMRLFFEGILKKGAYTYSLTENLYNVKYKAGSPNISLEMQRDRGAGVSHIIFDDYDGSNLPLLMELKDLTTTRFGLNTMMKKV